MPPTLEQPVVRSFNELARAFAGDYSFLEQRKDTPTLEQKRAWEPFVNGYVQRALTTYQGGASGGYLLDYEISKSVWDKARSEEGPLSECLIFPTTKHSFKVPAFEETSRVNGSRWGGIQAYWQGQEDSNKLSNAGTTTSVGATKPSLNMVDFQMQRLIVYTEPMSNDLLDDSGLVEAMLQYAAHHEMRYAITDKIINGTGTWCPLGMINAPCSVLQTRNTSSHIKIQDIDGMWSHMWPFCRRNAIFLTNDDGLADVDLAATSFNWPASYYMPEGGPLGNKWPLLKGRPLIVCEQIPALGTKGDLILADMTQYGLAVHQTVGAVPSIEVSYGRPEIGVEGTMSEHLKFDTDSSVFKFKIRLDGKPMWRSSLTIANSSQSASAFVVLN